MNLKNKIVVVVGGSQGFGFEFAKQLISEGAQVIVVSKNPERLEAAAREINALPLVANVRIEQELRAVAQQVCDKFGRIDIWVNSAGVFRVFPENENIDVERAQELMEVNFFGAVYGSRVALTHMRGNGGIVLNILSSAALDATRAINAELYAASKWALRGYIDAIRAENSESGVKFLSIYPGGMKTHLHDEALPKAFENFMSPNYVVSKVIENLRLEPPEMDLVIKRPNL